MPLLRSAAAVGVALLLVACQSPPPSAPPSASTPQPAAAAPAVQAWGAAADGTRIELVTLRNAGGMEVRIMTLGATITALRVPDRTRQFDDVVLGYDTVEGYVARPNYFGSVIGRYANRIGGGAFALDGAKYALAKNNGPNHLHGGVRGWDRAIWRAEPFQNASGTGVVLSHASPDGDEGYPGTVNARVTYTLNERNEITAEYQATTDKPTVINMTNHSFFNLAGSRAADILAHELTIDADRYTPVDETLIPTGEIAPLDGTPLDFRTATRIGARIAESHPQLQRGRGYDHNYVLRRTAQGLAPAASVYDPASGRTLEIATTEPGIQFYSGNFLDGTITGKGGRVYGHRSGFCLETQHFPDSPNKPQFPSTVLRPGQEYRSTTVFKFGVRVQQ